MQFKKIAIYWNWKIDFFENWALFIFLFL